MESMRNEVQRGWQLPIQLATLPMLPHAVIGPLGCADQMKLTADGSRKPSKRTTHDMSYKFSSQQPVNERVLEQALSPCIYGFAMRRLIHMIVALREEHGDQVSLYLSKSDLKSAYRRVQASPSLALQSITTTKGLLAEDETFAPKEDIALIALRLTFGGAPNPAFFSEISETITDTANMLSACRSWNQLSLCPQHRGLLGEPMKVDDALTSKVPFARARPMCVPVATPLTGGAECFIDDIFSVVPELPDQGIRADRMALATFLAIEVFGRPPTDHDPMPRDDLLALSKALAEGTPTETLIVTGWLLDTRRLLISLPDDKFQAWGGDIDGILEKPRRRCSAKELDSLVGRLQHTASVMSEGNHFLSRLRSAKNRAESSRQSCTRLSREELADLALWKQFLHYAHDGIDLNLLTARDPDVISKTDACPYQIGGYSVKTGRAWRWQVPPALVGLMSINFLEFIGCVLGALLAFLEGETRAGDCVLSVTDNTSSAGWLRKSNFAQSDEHRAHLEVARTLAITSMNHKCCLFSQWLAGVDNVIPDLLSRDKKRSDESLTLYIKRTYPNQVTEDFKVSPLPDELSSLLLSWVQHGAHNKASPKGPNLKRTPLGGVGSSSSAPVNWPTTYSSKASSLSRNSASSAPSPTPCARAGTASPHASELMAQEARWLRARARPPSKMWLRPSLNPDSQTHGSTPTVSNLCSSIDNSRVTLTSTPWVATRRPSL